MPMQPKKTNKHNMPTNYIPQPDAAFAAWLANFSAKLTFAPAAFNKSAGDAAAVATQNTSFAAALIAAVAPATRTSATVAAKDAARALAEAIVRPIATDISRSLIVTPANKATIGVTIPDPSRSPVAAPTTAPVLSIRAMIAGQITLDYRDATDPTARAKPAGVVAMQLFASFGTAGATDPSQLAFLAQVTKTPTIVSSAGNAGKIVSLAGRWVTRSGAGGVAQTGPWSAMLTSFVP